MTRKERVIRTIKREPLDFIPYNLDYTPPVKKMLEKHFGTKDIEEAIGNHLALIGGKGPRPLYADPAKYGEFCRDEFGVLWHNTANDRGQVAEYPLKKASLEGYQFPDLSRKDFEEVPAKIFANRKKFIGAVAGDLWERAYFLCPFSELLIAVRENPSFVEELLDKITEYNLKTLEVLLQYPFDAVYLSDDYGHQKNLMINPSDWRKLLKPRLKKIYRVGKEKGLFSILHSDGNISEIIPDLIEVGVDILHPVQPETMDIYQLKKEYGQDLTFWGGLDTQYFLPRATPGEIKKEVRKLKKELGENGGFILGSINIQADVPLANILALIEAAKEQ